jgi:hypothetical protein
VVHMMLKINSDCFPKQHYPVGLCSGEVSLKRSMDV